MQAPLPSSSSLDSALHNQSAIPPASDVQDSKKNHFDIPVPVHAIPGHGQSMDLGNFESGPVPLEDFWSQMLDESAHIALDTPDWMDLLTELTNATAPSE
jgi:hypothetical protein